MAKGGRKKGPTIWRNCPFCKHGWNGHPLSKRCPKCDKYIGPATKPEVEAATQKVKPAEASVGKTAGTKPENSDTASTDSDSTVVVKQEFKPLADVPQSATEADVAALQAAQGAKPMPDIPPKALAGPWKLIFDMAASFQKNEAWKLSEGEAESLGELSAPVVKKYAPDVLKEHYELAILGASLAAVIVGKMQLAAEYEKSKKAASSGGVGEHGGKETQPGPV